MRKILFVLLATFTLFVSSAFAQETVTTAPDVVVTLTPDLPSGQLVGTRINWTISVDNADPHLYRLAAGRQGEPLRVIYDYTPDNVLEWVTLDDGLYIVQGSAKNQNTGQVTTVAQVFLITPRAPLTPVVSFTPNALVAMYSAPKCPAGYTMRVAFIEFQTTRPSATTRKACDGAHTMNFYVGGMRQGALYFMVHQIFNQQGDPIATGPVKYFIAGTVPLPIPFTGPEIAPGVETSVADRIVLMSPIQGTEEYPQYPRAHDLTGRIVWYYDRDMDVNPSLYRPVAGGTFLMAVGRGELEGQILREIDLAGNVVRETTVESINDQLEVLGYTDPLTSFHHEARKLPNGHYAVIGSVERIMVDVQGPGPIDVLADYIVVLDEDFQLVWAWSGFDHLDPYRIAIMGETCVHQGPGCPPIFLAEIANDWMHSNAIAPTPDGDLILSMRHQDWVVKVNYDNGAGDGSVVWRLGPDGDFTLNDADPYPWFTHQHDPNFVSLNQLTIYDNGNTRCVANPELCYSRGQVYQLDTNTMTASLVVNANLGLYAFAVGSAQQVSNGNYAFDSGIAPAGEEFYSRHAEVTTATGAINYQLFTNQGAYRSFRMVDLYTKPGVLPTMAPVNPLEVAGQ